MYGAGIAYEISPSFDIRAEYRGFVTKVPTFGDHPVHTPTSGTTSSTRRSAWRITSKTGNREYETKPVSRRANAKRGWLKPSPFSCFRVPGDHEIAMSGLPLSVFCRFAVAAQLLHHCAMWLQRFKRAGAFFWRVNLAIHIEDVLPGLAVHGPRFDLGQVGAQSPRARAERGDQRTGPVLDGKGEADLVGMRIGTGIRSCAARERSA